MNRSLALPSRTSRDAGKTARSGRIAVCALVAADVVSLTGNRIALLAIPWFVLETTGSSATVGLVVFSSFLPLAAAAFIGGHVVDRLGGRRTSILADVASGLTALSITVAHRVGILSIPLLIVLVFLGTSLDGPGGTGRRTLLPEAAAVSGWSLEKVTSASESAYRSTQILGGVSAAGVIAVFGAPVAIAVNALTFGISALLIGVGTRALPVMRASVLPMRQALSEGIGFLKNDAVLRTVILLFVGANMLENALISVLLPTYAHRYSMGAGAIGWPVAAMGVGGLIGAVTYGWLARRMRLRPTLVLGLLLSGPPKFLVLAYNAPLWLVAAVFLLSNIAAGPINPMLSTLQLRRIPAGMRGRVLGASMSGVVATIPLAVLVAGAAADALPLGVLLTIGAAFYGLLAISPGFAKSLRIGPALSE